MTAELGRIISLGRLLGVDTAKLLGSLTALSDECARNLSVTLPQSFDDLEASTRAVRERARPACGAWLDALPGDELELRFGRRTTAFSDEAALPHDAPELVRTLGGELATLGHDGERWSYVVEHGNGDAMEDTLASIDRVAKALGVTPPQQRIVSGLHRSIARGAPTRAMLVARGGTVEPALHVIWDRVEWQPIGSMMSGFYPEHGAIGQLPRIAQLCEAESATVALVLGRTDPPGMRLTIRLA
ncbi:MAG: hypothetical protein JNL83_01870 [Myxococcales bacterium]|nr:hypothetical protein [Myxococcales bacterium]